MKSIFGVIGFLLFAPLAQASSPQPVIHVLQCESFNGPGRGLYVEINMRDRLLATAEDRDSKHHLGTWAVTETLNPWGYRVFKGGRFELTVLIHATPVYGRMPAHVVIERREGRIVDEVYCRVTR